jgi:hypothetical protein
MKHWVASCKAILPVLHLGKGGAMAGVMALLCAGAWMALVLTAWKLLAHMP